MTRCCDTISNAISNCNTTTARAAEREQAITQVRTQRLQKRRDALSKRIEDSRRPVNVIIHEMFHVDDQDHALIGKFKRESKQREYVSPRILLPWYFSKHIEKGCFILEGKVSVEGYSWLQGKDALILVVR